MKLFKYLILLIIIFTICSCGEQTGGLFYSLEQESAITNGNLPNDVTIGEMVRSNDYYFVAAGKFLYRSAADNGAWPEEDVNQNPTGYEDYLCYDLLLVGDTIYAAFYSTGSVEYVLFTADASSASTGLIWSSSSVSFSDGDIDSAENVTGFEHAGDAVFIQTRTSSNSYNVYAADYTDMVNNGTAASFEPIANDLNGRVISVDYDGTDYWLAAGSKVYTVNSALTTVIPITADIMAASSYLKGNGFNGIVCADTDTDAGVEVYLTSEEGVMLKYIDGGWIVIASQYDEDTGLFEPLKDIIHIEISSADEDINILLAGSENGYYEMEAAASAANKAFVSAEKIDSQLTTANQFSSIDISEGVINSFYFDTEGDDEGNKVIFALGYSSGLWKNSYKIETSGNYRFWDVE